MFFSIIVPIYNVEKYLAECIDSILSQTFSDFELILVDDGSPDSSGKICDEYAIKDSRVRVIHKENGGQSDARNVGTKTAQGEYILYIDSDDYIHDNNFLKDLYDKSQEKSSELILYKFQKYYDEKNMLEPCAFSMEKASQLNDADDILLELVRADAFYGAPWLKAIKRSLIESSNIEFLKGVTGEDMEWYIHLLYSNDFNISVIDKSYIAYRQRENSVSRGTKLKNLTDFIYVLEQSNDGVNNANISAKRKEALYGAMAKYYANLLICYVRVKDSKKKEYKKRIKALSSLLNYSKSQRPLLIKKVYSLVGFDLTTLMLKILDRIKG